MFLHYALVFAFGLATVAKHHNSYVSCAQFKRWIHCIENDERFHSVVVCIFQKHTVDHAN